MKAAVLEAVNKLGNREMFGEGSAARLSLDGKIKW